MMVLPDYSSGNNEKDIHVKNFNINVGGLELLDCADLKLAYGRKVRVRARVCFLFVCGMLWKRTDWNEAVSKECVYLRKRRKRWGVSCVVYKCARVTTIVFPW